jgi:hypothetical protein
LRYDTTGQHNWEVTTDGEQGAAPRRVPELTDGVTDEDRNRYGVLLDHAAERGLLSPTEYRVRLAGLAEATSVGELQRIVTELPVFEGTGVQSKKSSIPAAGRAAAVPADGLDAALWAGLTPSSPRPARRSPWLVLVAVVVMLILALVALALVAAHFAHVHSAGQAGVAVHAVSRLHL